MASTATLPQETVASLAARIKAKYPEYADKPDTDLVDRITQKYPEYNDRLSTQERLKLPTQATANYQAAKENEAAVAKQNQPAGPAWSRMAEGAIEGLKTMNPFRGMGSTPPAALPSAFDLVTAGMGPIPRMVKNAAEEYESARQQGQGVIPSMGAAGAGLVGLNAEDIRKRAQKGDVAGVIGEGIPAIATTIIGGEAGRIPAARAKLATKFTTEAGELTPGAKAAAKAGGMAVGGAAGELVGHPWIGGLMGERLGPSALKMMLGERPKPLGGIPPIEPVKPGPVSTNPFELTPPPTIAEPPVQQTLQFPTMEPAPRGSAMNRLPGLIEQAAGVPTLEPNLPLREQLPQFGGKVTFRNPRLLRTPEVEPGRMQRPEGMTGPTSKAGGIPEMIPEEVGREMGASPLEPNVPLRGQFKPRPEAPPSRQVTLEQKYPDKAQRQMVHANGEEMVDRIGNDPATMKAVHDLTNPDVRQAMINSGEDMGQRTVSNRKVMGEGSITRQDAFKKLLRKGFTPRQIVEMATRKVIGPKTNEEVAAE